MIFQDASFINRTSTGGYTWVPSGGPGGDVVEEKNAGCTGERWAILHVLADSRDGDWESRTELLRDSLLIGKVVAMSQNAPPPDVWIPEQDSARPVAGGRY